MATGSRVWNARRLLFISYAFPPVGGAGVQRSAKFVKYLPEFGWEPTVVTVANPSVPLMDNSHVEELGESTRIVRIPTWEPSYNAKKSVIGDTHSKSASLKRLIRRSAASILQPDPQVLWCWPAYRKVRRIVSRQSFDAVFVTGPPFSTFEMARRIAKQFSLPLILDFRDEWELSARHLENQGKSHWTDTRQATLFYRSIGQADSIITTTNASSRRLQTLANNRSLNVGVNTIHNGFDPSDFKSLSSIDRANDRFRLTYNGTLWNLTDATPLVRAVEWLADHKPECCRHLEIEFIGRRTPEQGATVAKLATLPCHLILQDYLAHHESLQRAKSADALCLLLADTDGSDRVVPAKMFEYLALRRPILNIGPCGEATELLEKTGNDANFHVAETHRIAQWLADRIDDKKSEHIGNFRNKALADDLDAQPNWCQPELEWCTRRHLTEQLANVLTDTTQRSSAILD